MSEVSERILKLLGDTLPKMNEPGQERVLWFVEGMAAVVRSGQDSA